jgi:hypothetical protein
MLIKGIIDEDFINYKKPSMVIMCRSCTFKCDKECGKQVCQNSALANSPDIEVNYSDIINKYLNNPITKALVFSGLDPFDDFIDMYFLIQMLRLNNCKDDVVIYTGYTEDEIFAMKTENRIRYIDILKTLSPVIIKYGRFIPDQQSHYDEILGVNLASNNQYAIKYE